MKSLIKISLLVLLLAACRGVSIESGKIALSESSFDTNSSGLMITNMDTQTEGYIEITYDLDELPTNFNFDDIQFGVSLRVRDTDNIIYCVIGFDAYGPGEGSVGTEASWGAFSIVNGNFPADLGDGVIGLANTVTGTDKKFGCEITNKENGSVTVKGYLDRQELTNTAELPGDTEVVASGSIGFVGFDTLDRLRLKSFKYYEEKPF